MGRDLSFYLFPNMALGGASELNKCLNEGHAPSLILIILKCQR